MHSIGNYHDALTILHWVRGSGTEYGIPTVVEHEEAPMGWEFVGRGSFRSVWLSPEGVAYKVDHSSGRWEGQCEIEIENLKAAWGKDALEGCRLPKFSEYEISGSETVVAIELISGELFSRYRGANYRLYRDLMRDLENHYDLIDLHNENVMIDEDGLMVPIDLGC